LFLQVVLVVSFSTPSGLELIENNPDNEEKQLGFSARQPPRAVGMADTPKRC
jgi:hypothetical protein